MINHFHQMSYCTHLTDPYQDSKMWERVIQNNNNSSSNLDIEENSPFQEGIISLRQYKRPDKTFFQKPKSLDHIIDTGNLIHKFLPKQMDIDKILQIIQRKGT